MLFFIIVLNEIDIATVIAF